MSAGLFDVLLFDYRGYGQSTGTPSEEGTYRDSRAALECMLDQPAIDPARVLYLGESLGGAVALELALEHPPGGLVLLSSFTGVRALSRTHYPFIPAALVPDAYPNLSRIPRLRAPLLVLHGERDEIVPLTHASALFETAPQAERLQVFPGLGHGVRRCGGRAARASIGSSRRISAVTAQVRALAPGEAPPRPPIAV